MHILYLSKRHYMRRDVIGDRYGRLYELPRHLAAQGHEVDAVCLSYRHRAAAVAPATDEPGTLHWYSVAPGRLRLPPFAVQRRLIDELVAQRRPDIVLGTSDVAHVAVAARVAARHDLPLALDLYDNYASFGLARVPGLERAYRRALSTADVVFCVSEPLRRHVAETCRPGRPTVTLESTINAGAFVPLDRENCRERLGLPCDQALVGASGSLDPSRDIDTVYAAWRRLRAGDASLGLVLAGHPGRGRRVPREEGVYYLGELAHDAMPAFVNALDVAIICMRDSAFGRYAFPQKAYEIIACETPLVAADVGAMGTLFAHQPHTLYRPGDADDLARAIGRQLHTRVLPGVAVPTWAEQAQLLAQKLGEARDR